MGRMSDLWIEMHQEAEMNEPRYTNIDERYGNREQATLADYEELNPAGEFEQRADGIYENITDRAGRTHWQLIAQPADAEA